MSYLGNLGGYLMPISSDYFGYSKAPGQTVKPTWVDYNDSHYLLGPQSSQSQLYGANCAICDFVKTNITGLLIGAVLVGVVIVAMRAKKKKLQFDAPPVSASVRKVVNLSYEYGDGYYGIIEVGGDFYLYTFDTAAKLQDFLKNEKGGPEWAEYLWLEVRNGHAVFIEGNPCDLNPERLEE